MGFCALSCVGVTTASSFWYLQQLIVYLRVPNLLCGLVFKSQTQRGGVRFPFFFSVQAKQEGKECLIFQYCLYPGATQR